MFRYLIALGDPNDREHRENLIALRRGMAAAVDRWRVVLDQSNCLAACVEDIYHQGFSVPLHQASGVILGLIFRSAKHPRGCGERPLLALTRDESIEIVRSAGRVLIEHYWGHYVALVRIGANGRFVVLRSPVSPLPCFQRRWNATNVFFSHVPDCLDLIPGGLSLNWDCLTAQVVGNDYLTSETGLREVTAVDCGSAVVCGDGAPRTSPYWDPRSFLEHRSIDEFPHAVEAVRSATDYCVAALSSVHERLLVKVSGGLDSSIVLDSLNRAAHAPTLHAVNYYSPGSGDERVYARCMAQNVSMPLMEIARNDAVDLRCFQHCNLTARPVLNFSAADSETQNIALARELGATALVDGELGDNVFGAYPGPGALLECGKGLPAARKRLSAALDYAALTRQSLWRTVRLSYCESRDVARNPDFVAAHDLRRRYGNDVASSMFLASVEAQAHGGQLGDRFVHPWLKDSRRLAPGSHPLIFGLIAVTSTAYHSPFSLPGDPPGISPLVGQPLVECSLRIPSHLHIHQGQDRAVARTAFARGLPDMIIQRGLGKGGPTQWIRDIVANNTAFFREFLGDGILVKRGLIDRQKLETLLTPGVARSAALTGDLIAKTYVEAWLRNWPAAR